MREALLALVFLLPLAGYTQTAPDYSGEGFELQSSEDGVFAYTRSEKNGDMTVRVTATLRSSAARILEILDNVPAYKQWIHRCDGAYIHTSRTKDDYIYVSGVNMPFPFSDREVVARVVNRVNAKTGALYRTTTSLPNEIPPTKGRERLARYEAIWTVDPTATPGTVRMTCTVTTDAGGGLPTWLREEVMTGGPVKTFTNLRTRALAR